MKNLLDNPKLITAATDQPHLIRCYTPYNTQGQTSYETNDYGNLVRPQSWRLWCVHATEFRPDWDPTNTRGWIVPEIKQTELKPDGSPQFSDRWHGDARSLVFFNDEGISKGGIIQRIQSIAGHNYTFGGWGEAWNANNEWPTNPHCSWGAECQPFAMLWDEIRQVYSGQQADALESVRFRVGLDPLGGDNPLAQQVVWGPWIAIYNAWAEIPSVSAKAQGAYLAAFVHVENCLRTIHNDRYFTDFWLIDNDEGGEEPPPEPNPDYTYPVVAKGPKLHPHAIGEAGTYDATKYMVDHGSPFPFIKVLAPQPADMAAVINIMGLSPTTKIIARAMKPYSGNVNIEGPDFGMDAQIYMNSMKGYFDAYKKYVWAWELWNEQDLVGIDGHVKMANFAIACMTIAEQWGIRLALMSYSTGVPENEEWQGIWDRTQFFQRAKAGGHVLSLHAYCRSKYPEELNSHLLRPQWLYETILEPNNCVVPFVFTEYNLHEINGGGIWNHPEYPTLDSLMAEYVLVDELLGSMYYCLGASVFTFGQGWERYNLNTVWKRFCDTLLTLKDVENALPPADPEPPVQGYDRTVWVADPTYLNAEQVTQVYSLARTALNTVGPSWNDAVPLAEERPEEWKTNTVHAPGLPFADQGRYLTWVSNRDIGTVLDFPRLDTGEVDPPQDPDPGPTPSITAYRQCRPPWGGTKLGTSNYTMCSSGCAVTDSASLSTFVDPTMDPWKMVKWLNANGGFTGKTVSHEAGLLVWTKVAEYVDGLEYKNYYTWRSAGQVADLARIREALTRGPVIVQVDYDPSDADLDSHFGVLVEDLGNDFLMMDPIDGTFCNLMERYGRGDLAHSVFAMVDFRFSTQPTPPPPPPPPAAEPPLIGFNDHTDGAAKFLAPHGRGLIVRPVFLDTTAQAIDMSAYANAGLRIIVNLRYSWSTDKGGRGTLPAYGSAEWAKFVNAAIQTIKTSKGIWGWSVANEQNGPREHPIGAPLTPFQVADTYNKIRAGAPGHRMAIGALDPFNAERGDPRDWQKMEYDTITGAEFVVAHGYIRGPDPALVGSTDKFADAPLQWQYLNYPGCVTQLLSYLPKWALALPVYMTETDHLWKTSEAVGDIGWVTDDRAAEVIYAIYEAAEEYDIAGVAVYRWTGDEWSVENSGVVKDTVIDLL